jgi:hypothetical protein
MLLPEAFSLCTWTTTLLDPLNVALLLLLSRDALKALIESNLSLFTVISLLFCCKHLNSLQWIAHCSDSSIEC